MTNPLQKLPLKDMAMPASEWRQIDFRLPNIGNSGTDRSSGIHLSSILNHIERERVTAGILKRHDNKGGAFSDMELTADMGFTWERALELAWADRMCMRPGEFECDGIAMSPDGLDMDGTKLMLIPKCLYEFKLTWRGFLKFRIENEWRWEMQTKSYCHATGARTAVIIPCFVMGDWKQIGPKCDWAYVRTYTMPELVTNWNRVIKMAREKGMI